MTTGAQLPECSVIIPVYNKWELTRDCLASLREHSAAHDLQVIVVDNGSSDATARDLDAYGESLFGPRFTSLSFAENNNFGPACNAGARAARSPVLFFLNNDTLLTPGWLPPLLAALNGDENLGAVGPLLLYGDGSVQHLGVGYGLRGPLHLYRTFPADHPVIRRRRPLQAITGAACMLRADLFRECGGFCEEYVNGFEDLELCARLAKKGKKLLCVPESSIFHLESQTPGRNSANDRNAALFAARCGKDVFVDMHHHALRDGFSVRISDAFTLSVTLREAAERALMEEAHAKDGETLQDLIRQHPFWVGGRELLAAKLGKEARFAEALGVHLELVILAPSLARYDAALSLAPHVPGGGWQEEVAKKRQEMLLCMTDKAVAKMAVRAARSRFRPEGEPFLDTLFEAKLAELFPA